MRAKGLIITAGCVLALAFGCHKSTIVTKPAEQKAPAPPIAAQSPVAKDQPQIIFENLLHDFGRISPNETVSCEFKFENTGKGLLKIEDVHATCGCTTPELAKKEYQPDESGVITVKYHASVRPHADTKHVLVQSNDPNNPKVTLTIKAQIVNKVSVEPEKLMLSLKQPNGGCPPLKITSLDNKSFAIKRIESTCDCVTFDYNTAAEANQFNVQPKVDVEKLRQTFGLEGNLTIDINHPQCATLTVPYVAQSEFRVEPPVVTILNAEPNKPVLKQVAVKNNYNDSFELESVTSRLGYTKILSQQKDPNNGYSLELQITPPPPRNNAKMFSDVLMAKVKNGEIVKINCRGFYSRGPKQGLPDANQPHGK